MTINCIVIDDEPLARKGLKEYIDEVDFLKLAGEFDAPLKAVDLMNKGDIHLIFLDIQMPKITGLDFVKTIQHPLPVIFTTAYPQYAWEGFEVNALDYLVKPISFERFLKAALKAKEYYEVRQRNIARETDHPVATDYFFIKADSKLIKIFFDDILFIEALQNYVVIHTRDRKFITYLTFRSVEEYLPVDSFAKSHKSYIVSLSKIQSVEGNEIHIVGHRIPISRNEKDQFMDRLLKGKFLKR